MLSKINEAKIKTVAQEIARKFKPDKIILFGSYAWGTPGPDSDVDLFIIKETDNTRETAREIDGSIRPRPFPIDLIVYKPASVEKSLTRKDFFIRNIMTKGITLYAK